MRRLRAVLPVVVVISIAWALAGGQDPLAAERLAELRARGPEGLKILLDEHAGQIAAGAAIGGPSWRRLSYAIDQVAMQKDAWASKFYWYTDLDQAKAAAAREGKPILSLRLLGKLNEDLSCANSRFFRTTLYPDLRVSSLLREKFILHWSSERPVPVVTIDFGDGRTMKRTVTGNSIHYVMDADGRLIDALPGLYSASAFVRGLESALTIASKKPTDAELRAWHDVATTRLEQKPAVTRQEPFAREVEYVVRLNAMSPAQRAARFTVTKAVAEDPLLGMVAKLQKSIAEDTVQNEYVLHRQIHQWFATGAVKDFNTFNQRVYAELFLTPRSDPWLGLAPADAFSAVEAGGLVQK